MKPPQNSDLIKKLTAIVEELGANFEEIMVVYLYGSVINGYATDRSDIDMAILVDKSKIVCGLWEKLDNYCYFFEQNFRQKEIDVTIINQAPLSFKYNVIKKGVVIYSRSEDFRVEFEVRVMKEFLDFKFHYDQYSKDLIERLSRRVP